MVSTGLKAKVQGLGLGFDYIFACDNCGTGQECDSWAEVIDFMNEEGWKKRLIDGEWKHFCPECGEVKEP